MNEQKQLLIAYINSTDNPIKILGAAVAFAVRNTNSAESKRLATAIDATIKTTYEELKAEHDAKTV